MLVFAYRGLSGRVKAFSLRPTGALKMTDQNGVDQLAQYALNK